MFSIDVFSDQIAYKVTKKLPQSQIIIYEGVVKQVAKQLVALRSKVYQISFCHLCRLPLTHRPQTAHKFELVEYRPSVLYRKFVHSLLYLDGIGVWGIPTTAYLPVRVVVGDEYEDAVGRRLTYLCHQCIVIVFECLYIEVCRHGIVDTDTEYYHIGSKYPVRRFRARNLYPRTYVLPYRVAGNIC